MLNGTRAVEPAHYAHQVRVFHDAFGCAAPAAPGPMDDQTRLARAQLVTEEVGELLWSMAASDLIEVLDALGDLEYVLCGALVACGADRCGHDLPACRSSSEGPPRLIATDLGLVISSTLLDGASALCMALSTNDWTKVALVSSAMLNNLGGVWMAFGVPEDLRQLVLAEVHRSNMTKFGADGRPVVNEAGRVVKGPNFEEPDLLGVLRSYYGPTYEPPALRSAPGTPLSGAPR